jgi:hypothetical protein
MDTVCHGRGRCGTVLRACDLCIPLRLLTDHWDRWHEFVDEVLSPGEVDTMHTVTSISPILTDTEIAYVG